MILSELLSTRNHVRSIRGLASRYGFPTLIGNLSRRILDHGRLDPHEEEHLKELMQWFNANLETPTRFTSSKPPYYRKRNGAISWFKDSAHQHISKMREMAAIVENHGFAARMLKSDRVGYIAYEDEWQVVADPFSDVDW